MSISAVGSAAGYTPPIRPHVAAAPRAAEPVKAGADSDGDNDGSRGGTVDVRA